MSSLTAEYQLLRRAARSCLGEAADDPGAGRPHAQIDWNQVLWVAREQGALLLLHEALRHDLPEVACPAEIRSQLESLSVAAKFQGLARTALICRLHDTLSGAGIPFFLVDEWMFQTCFHPDQVLIEFVTPIRCLLRSDDLTEARAILSEAGLPPTTSGVQIASFAQSPVECIATLADDVPSDALFSCPGEENGISLPGQRLLRRLPDHEWLLFAASPWMRRATLPILPAFQLSLLASRSLADQPVRRPAWVDAVIAAGRATLNGSIQKQAHGKRRSGELAAVFPPACPFLPTPASVIERMLTLAAAGPNDTVLDLGCGDGAIVITAAQRCGARAIGIDCDQTLVATAKARAEAAGVGARVSFICGDLFAADFAAATVICLYLAPAFYPALQDRILTRARPGTRIVSHDYFFSAWPPIKTELVRVSAAQVSQIFVWRVP